jgi:hypothetical protein
MDAALAFSSPMLLPLCRTCEDLATRVRGFDALLSLCSGSCPCVAAPVGVLDLTEPDACVPACEGASVTNTCVLAGGVHAEEQPVLEVHSKSDAFCACVPVAEQNFQMDIPPELPVHSELQCADGVPFEEADEVRDEEWGEWTAFVETHIDSAAVVAVDALAVCKLSEWLTAVPAISATVCAVISVGLVAEIEQTLLLAVVCSALATRCRDAFAVSSSVAVELIDPGCDPPLLSCY